MAEKHDINLVETELKDQLWPLECGKQSLSFIIQESEFPCIPAPSQHSPFPAGFCVSCGATFSICNKIHMTLAHVNQKPNSKTVEGIIRLGHAHICAPQEIN